MTRQRFLGGRFEARVAIAAQFGVCSAIWFPQVWAGEPDFAKTVMRVDWVRIGPVLPAAGLQGQDRRPE
jgi:hypothetical protein